MSGGSDGPLADRYDEGDRPQSSFLRVLAEAPASVLEEELLRLEEEQRKHPEELRADYYAVVRVRELVERRRRRERELASLYATAHDLAVLRGVDDVLTAIVHRAHVLMGTDLTYLQVYDPETGELRTRAAEGVITPEFRGVSAPAGVGIARLAICEKAPRWVRNYREASEFGHDPDGDRIVAAEGLVAVLAVPLLAGQRVGGVLCTGYRVERPFGASEIALLVAFANHAAVALENARLFDESRRSLAALREAYDTIQAQVAASERAAAVHAALTEVILRGGAVGDLADVLADSLGGTLVIVDRVHHILAARGEPLDDDDRASVAQALKDSRRSGCIATLDEAGSAHRCVVAIVAGGTYLGGLIHSRRSPLDPADARMLERAAQITALLTLLRDARLEAEERVRGELLSDLLHSRGRYSSDVLMRVQARHVELSRINTVLVIAAESGRGRDATRALHDMARQSGGLAGEHLGMPTLLTNAVDGIAEAADNVHRHLKSVLGVAVLVCAAPTEPTPDQMARSFALASRCCRLMHRIGLTDRSLTTTQFGIYGMLFDPERGEELTLFVEETLGTLMEHDAKKRTNLVDTLATYFANSANLAKTARALNIHINTLLKRMERITSLLGAGWQQPDGALRTQLAVQFYRFANSPDRPTT